MSKDLDKIADDASLSDAVEAMKQSDTYPPIEAIPFREIGVRRSGWREIGLKTRFYWLGRQLRPLIMPRARNRSPFGDDCACALGQRLCSECAVDLSIEESWEASDGRHH